MVLDAVGVTETDAMPVNPQSITDVVAEGAGAGVVAGYPSGVVVVEELETTAMRMSVEETSVDVVYVEVV